jgi:hypothetical protein
MLCIPRRLNRYSFLVEYNDTQAALVRQYQLLCYLADNTIEMHDLKNRRFARALAHWKEAALR